MLPDGNLDALDGVAVLIPDGAQGLEVGMGLSVHVGSLQDILYLAAGSESQQSQNERRQFFPKMIHAVFHVD